MSARLAAWLVADVLDTGVRIDHVDFGGRAIAEGWSAGTGGNWVTNGVITQATRSCSNHGTHCASTAGGTTYGVAKQATIVPVQVSAVRRGCASQPAACVRGASGLKDFGARAM